MLCTGLALGVAVLLDGSVAVCVAAAAVGAAFGQLVGFTNTTLVKGFFSSLRFIFFREVDSRNSHWVPKSGPIMFVCAPHGKEGGRREEQSAVVRSPWLSFRPTRFLAPSTAALSV